MTPGLIIASSPASGKTKSKNPYDERRLLEQNKRIQRENNVPEEFPNFVREGFFIFSGDIAFDEIISWK